MMYFGIQTYAKRYERIFSGLEEVFASAGGTFFGLYQVFAFTVAIFSSVNMTTRMMELILGQSLELNDCAQE